MNKDTLERGDVCLFDVGTSSDKPHTKTRLGVIVTNNEANRFCTRVIILPIVENYSEIYPFEAEITVKDRKVKVSASPIYTLSKERIYKKVGCLSQEEMKAVDNALKIELALE